LNTSSGMNGTANGAVDVNANSAGVETVTSSGHNSTAATTTATTTAAAAAAGDSKGNKNGTNSSSIQNGAGTHSSSNQGNLSSSHHGTSSSSNLPSPNNQQSGTTSTGSTGGGGALISHSHQSQSHHHSHNNLYSSPSSLHSHHHSHHTSQLTLDATKGMKALYCAAAAEYARSTSYFDGTAPSPLIRRRRRSKNAARPGDQVAARITLSDENGSWILASVQRFYADTETYDVQDEDDTSKLIRLPWNHVMRLSTGTEGCFEKNTKVMAIFPETTSFYRAVVSKQPVWKLESIPNSYNSSTHSANGCPSSSSSSTQHNHHFYNQYSTGGTAGTCSSNNNPSSNNHYSLTTPIVKELILKFEDDEDENGRTPHRRVPSRYVIPVPQAYFYEDEDDVDLAPPNNSYTMNRVVA